MKKHDAVVQLYYTGDILLVDFYNSVGHQQSGVRPALVVSNNVGNARSEMLEVLPITTKRNNSRQPTHVTIKADTTNGLRYDSTIEAEGKIPINKFQVRKRIGHLTDDQLELVAMAMVYATPIVVKAFNKGVHNTDLFLKLLNS